MNPSDKAKFSALLKATLDVYGVNPSADATSLWWECLKRYPFADVRSALSGHLQDAAVGRFAPKPADVIGRMQANDGWIGVEEAWAIVSQTLNDERVTVFWTGPMQEAFGVAIALQDDEVAARMAFKEVYTAKLALARKRGEEPIWQMSPGTDVAGRDAAIEEALRLRRITPSYSERLLSHGSERPLLESPASVLIAGLKATQTEASTES